MPTLERSNPLPLYYQLKEALKQQIIAGHLAPHSVIPSEPELVSSYHVSRATVRQALSELVREGLLYREHGRGTYVSDPRVQQDVSELSSLTQVLRKLGKRPGGLLLVGELLRGSAIVREQLRLGDADQAIRLERVRLADDLPIAHEIDYLPYPRAASIYERAKELADGSLYAVMASEGLTPAIVEQSVDGDAASQRAADLLRIPAGEPGMRVVSTTFDSTGAPIAYSVSFYPQGRYTLQIALRVTR